MGGAEDNLTLLVMEMIKYASKHNFQGKSMDADLFGFCELNKQYCRLEKKMHSSSEFPPLADKWDVARNKIVTYITSKFNDMPPDPTILASAWLSIAEPYISSLMSTYPLRKAL